MHEYRCSLDRVIDGDTIDVHIDLGFKIILSKERVRLLGINTPESRTRNLEEKALGLAAKARLKELLPKKFIIEDVDICQQLIDEGHARVYHGGTKVPWV